MFRGRSMKTHRTAETLREIMFRRAKRLAKSTLFHQKSLKTIGTQIILCKTCTTFLEAEY